MKQIYFWSICEQRFIALRKIKRNFIDCQWTSSEIFISMRDQGPAFENGLYVCFKYLLWTALKADCNQTRRQILISFCTVCYTANFIHISKLGYYVAGRLSPTEAAPSAGGDTFGHYRNKAFSIKWVSSTVARCLTSASNQQGVLPTASSLKIKYARRGQSGIVCRGLYEAANRHQKISNWFAQPSLVRLSSLYTNWVNKSVHVFGSITFVLVVLQFTKPAHSTLHETFCIKSICFVFG